MPRREILASSQQMQFLAFPDDEGELIRRYTPTTTDLAFVRVTKSDPAQFVSTGVQKSYFMLSRSARAVLDTALRKYRPGLSEPILVGGLAQLKPALRLMTSYRLMIRDVVGNEVLTSYTRWLDCVQLKEGAEQEVYVAFSPRFERIWLESKKRRLPEYMEQKPADASLRSQFT